MTRRSAINKQNSLTLQQALPREPIAIIGIGCRFPGGVNNPETFWSLLCNGINAVTEIPSDRIDLDTYYDPRPATPGKMMTRWGGFLKDIDQFDAYFFGISPREAERLDPQQRLLLEVAWEALEDAGIVFDQVKGSHSGVFVGLWLNDFESRLFANPELTDFYMTTGSGRYSASGRLSYFLGMQGPSITVDTACSSSLVAINLACQSLWLGECSMALAGGANIILQPHISIAYSQSKMMAPDGLCKFGDAQADGYVRSEGAALIALKPLSQAIADKNPIYALIRGGAVNNDGQSSGFLATPGQKGQEEMLRIAYRNAGIDPRKVQYIEAHGTGTRAGDPVELGALGTVVGAGRLAADPCLVGSVKTNLGHTEGAAGIAGLIKVALSLKNKLIPPSLHLKTLNPNIPWDQLGLTIPTTLTPWPVTEEAIAAVSAFGIAGTNAHIVLSEWSEKDVEPSKNITAHDHVLALSAYSPEALVDLAKAYSDFLMDEHAPAVADICYTANCRRTPHAERLAVIGKSHRELAEQISFYQQQNLEGGLPGQSNKVNEQAKVVFVFPGQGAQWLGMGRELLSQNEVFHKVLQACNQAFKPWVDWSLFEQLSLEEGAPNCRIDEIEIIQPILFAIEIGLAAVWQSWGIEPSAVIGHSMGEVAAAYVAGALTLEDAAHVICKRSQLMQSTSGQGAMAVVGLPFDKAKEAIQGYEDKLSIAVHNSPRSVVLSGDPKALEGVLNELRGEEIFCRPVRVDVASHSPQMDPLRPELVASLSGIEPRTTTIPFYSTVTEEISDGSTLDSEYWGNNLRRPVQFSNMIQKLVEANHSVFIEMSPHPILLTSIQEVAGELNRPAYAFASLRRDQSEMRTMLGELGSLYNFGYRVDWSKLFPDSGRVVSLPNYPWQRERYWFQPASTQTKQARPGAHPFLQQHIHAATGIHVWETTVSIGLFPYLGDHKVRGSVVFPAAAYVEMALAAASEIYGSRPRIIRTVAFQEALLLPTEDHRIIQLVLTSDTQDAATFQIFSCSPNEDSAKLWTLHASGTIEIVQEVSIDPDISLTALRAGDQAEAMTNDFYRAASAHGLEYGSNFRAITRLIQQPQDFLAKVELPEELISQATRYGFHPVLIDACFQTLLAALPKSNQDTYLPASIEALRVHDVPDFSGELWCYATVRNDAAGLAGDIFLYNGDGQITMSARNLHLQRLEAKQEVQDLLYEINWQEGPLPYQEKANQKHWLIFSDRAGLGESLAEYFEKRSQTSTLVSMGKAYGATAPLRYEIDPLQPAHFQQLLRDMTQSVQGIIHLWSLENDPIPSITDPNLLSILYLVQAIGSTDMVDVPRLCLVTRGTQTVHAQPEPVSVSQSAAWGMGAVIANEFPQLHCRRIDLSPSIMEGELELFARILEADDHEDQVALRNRQRYVARLKQYPPMAEGPENIVGQKLEKNSSFQVQITTPGILDHLSLKPLLQKRPGAGQVEIGVKATGLNFMNVMSAMGIYPGYPNGVGPLGIECAGIVLRVGEDVTGFDEGDEVVAIAFDCLGSHAITDARLVVKKPFSLSLEEAASLPIAFVTAYYALQYLGRLQKNESVLIHSATGGVGLAAIQLAKRAGAEIFATAGSPEKREYLHNLGVENVMDSRSLTFAEEIMKMTQGAGVDLVLNSLSGNAIAKGLEILRPYGRFLEIGKRDIYQNSRVGLLPFHKNLSYFAIDLDKMIRERPDTVGQLLDDIFNLVEKGELSPLPIQRFPISKVADAFRTMAQARHIGKITISLEDPEASLEIPVGRTPVRTDATYLITGGLGGLGLTFADWLARQGARHLVLMGRNKPSEAAQTAIEQLEASGIKVILAQADVADIDQLSAVFAQIKKICPPLKGVIHAAGLLADGTVLQMDRERFEVALAPKVLGSWNLHLLSANEPLDFFILFSSVAAILGTPGQVNYAAGNAFLDGLARFRRAQNLPALSINWGPWSEIGMASEQTNRGERLTLEGLLSISPQQGLEAMDHLLTVKRPQITVMAFQADQWLAAQPGAYGSSFFGDLRNSTETALPESGSRNDLRNTLLGMEPGRQRRLLFEKHVLEQVAYVLRMPPARLPADKPLRTLGLDSLMSLELRNRLEDVLGISIPAAAIWNYPTVMTLIAFLATRMDIPLETETVDKDKTHSDAPQQVMAETEETSLSSDLDHLSKAELDALLKEELDAIQDFLGDS